MHTRSPWLIVTVLLAKLRPAWSGSTVISTGSSVDPPRAKMIWTVFTVLPSWPSRAAMIVWAMSWPPNTGPPWPNVTLEPRNVPGPVGSSAREPRRSSMVSMISGG